MRGCRRAIRQRARPSRQSSPRPAITSRSWWWRRNNDFASLVLLRFFREDRDKQCGKAEARLGKLGARLLPRPILVGLVERRLPFALKLAVVVARRFTLAADGQPAMRLGRDRNDFIRPFRGPGAGVA